ncbi:hypothetical protein HDR58_08355 [bacterium]|nr:hypothetical protein [bacterium]
MDNVYSASSFKPAVGIPSDYNRNSASKRIEETQVVVDGSNYMRTENNVKNEFAQAVYGDGPYSLDHPNMLTEFNAVNIDYLA